MAQRIHGIISMQPKMALIFVFVVASIFAIIQPTAADAEWMNDCGVCHCKWISSKKQADCKNTSLISVPREMSVELQVIDLSTNIIPELRSNEFRDANLPNLHKIYMRNCTLQEIHRDAFKGLTLLIELDLSNNYLKVLYPGTFTDVIRLRVLIVTHNQIEHLGDNLFENLGFLAKVDFRYNELKSISQHTFVNVSTIREIDLENNQLTVLKEESFRGMDQLRSLTLNQNPWNCTCELQAFQKFAIQRGLYTPPTDCYLPMNLRGKLWTEVPAENFACRPVILMPHDGFTIDATNENITITCRMKASPKPRIEWQRNNQPINAEDQRISIRENEETSRMSKSVDFYVSDLVITGVNAEDRGTYSCIATNTGGQTKVDVHVIVPPVLESLDGMGMISSTAGIPTTNQTNLLFIICLIAIILLTLLIIVVLILCCYCRRVKKYSKNGSISENGLVSSKIDRSTDGSMLEGSVIMEMQKSLLTEVNPVEKPPRRSDTDGKSIPSDDVQEIKKTLLDEQSYGHHEDETHSIALSDTTPRSRATFVDDGYGTNLPPDLLSFPARYPPSSSTQSSITNIPDGNNLYIKSPIASPIYQHNAYAAQQAGYRTLQHPKNRNLAIINRTNSPFQPAPILYAPIVMPQQGYVTIPRKPRTPSWAPSIASTLVDFPPTSPTSTISTELAIDPIYDNLGLRTSASGHSALSVNKLKALQQQQQQLQQQQMQQQPMIAVSVSGSLEQSAGPSYTMKDRPLPATPRIYDPIQEQQIFPNGGELSGMNDDTELLFNKSIESHPIIVSANAINNNTISNISTSNTNLSSFNNNNANANGTLDKTQLAGLKVPPRPPPKPKKKMPTISAITENPELAADGTQSFQDECEDGTESRDRLALLPDGRLRHYIQNPDNDDSDAFNIDVDNDKEALPMHDYAQGKYCMDRAISTKGMTFPSEFAMVCSPEKESDWTDTDFLLRKVVNPVCHGISITILLVVGITYFVVPSLRDLVGNIITTMTCCLIIGQVANLMRIFTEFQNHFNFLILDILDQVSVMATFFWLSSLGYFIWKTFRSRNVFLRITDGKKYCWYSFYVWGSTFSMAAMGVFAHYYLDYSIPKRNFSDKPDSIESIGLLGLFVFSVTNCIAIGLSIYFYVSTHNYLSNRLNASYGRIHHKLKSNFIMFALLLILFTISWVLTLISRIEYEGMFYLNLTISAIQAPLVLFICVLRQKHVTYLLQKACCSKQPLTGADWGDEMTYINTANHWMNTTNNDMRIINDKL